MYYVKPCRTTNFVARAPRISDNASVGNLPDHSIFYYDYDDEERWTTDALRFEERRARDDPAALVALRIERRRRDGSDILPSWFDDIDEMIEDLKTAAEQEPNSVWLRKR